MRLQDVVISNAAYYSNVTVEVDRRFPYVTIHDDTGCQEDIFMQDDSACQFVAEVDAISVKEPDLDFGLIELCVAGPYCDNLWN